MKNEVDSCGHGFGLYYDFDSGSVPETTLEWVGKCEHADKCSALDKSNSNAIAKVKHLVMTLKNQEVVYLQRLVGYNTLMKMLAMVSGYERMPHDEVLQAIGDMIEEVMGDDN